MLNETTELKKIGWRLRKLRLKKGYKSAETFAVDHGLSRMQYWRMENGLTNLTFRSLIVVLKIHKVNLKDFFGDNF